MNEPPVLQPASAVPDDAEADITFVCTSCGRPDLLARTLESFFEYNTYPIREFIVIEDGIHPSEVSSDPRFVGRQIKWLATGRRVGQMAAIDIAYAHITTEYIFHCEDDWEFYAAGFIEKSLRILRRSPEVLQVWLRALDDTNKLPIMDHVFEAGGVPYRFIRPGYDAGEWGTWHGFSLNPGLRRLKEYQLVGSFSGQDPQGTMKAWEIESALSEVYLRHGFLAAILADADGKGYVRHLGWHRRVGDPTPEDGSEISRRRP